MNTIGMALVNIQNYFKHKSIKLSDSFIVIIDGKESYRCASFTPPKIAEWNEEEYNFGNVSQKFLIPKLDIVQELQIELYEGYTKDETSGAVNGLKTKKFIQQLKDDGISFGKAFESAQDFRRNGYNAFNGTYVLDENTNLLKIDHKTLDILILDNKLSKAVYEYRFRNLRLCKAEPYELNYQDESLTKWNLSYIFEEMDKGAPTNGYYKSNADNLK